MVDVHEGVEEFMLPRPVLIGGRGAAMPEDGATLIGYDAAPSPLLHWPRHAPTAEQIVHELMIPLYGHGRLQVVDR